MDIPLFENVTRVIRPGPVMGPALPLYSTYIIRDFITDSCARAIGAAAHRGAERTVPHAREAECARRISSRSAAIRCSSFVVPPTFPGPLIIRFDAADPPAATPP